MALGACGHHVSKLSDTEAKGRLTAMLQQTADTLDPGRPHRVTGASQGACSDFLNRDYAHDFDADVELTFPADELPTHFFRRVEAYWRSHGYSRVKTLRKGTDNETPIARKQGFTFGADLFGSVRQPFVQDGRHKVRVDGGTPCVKGT